MDIKNSMKIGMYLLRLNPDKKSGDLLQKMMTDAVVDMATKSEHGEKFKSRKKGAIGKYQKYFNELVAANPTLKPAELVKLADTKIIGTMPVATMKNKISLARKHKEK
jgi:hypothetical protein